ncbi:MAG TPA: hypothetical protein VFU15_13685 [Bacteroidia bacterium]|nr:hypothetical protein [Bacteroidia bacterium]
MKKLALFVFLSVVSLVPVSAQSYLEIGYRYGIMHPGNINRGVYTYNYTRPWLSQKMDFFKVMKGWEFSYMRRTDGAGLEFSMGRISGINNAFGIEPTTGQMAYRKIKFGTGGFSAGLRYFTMQTAHFESGPSLDFDFNFVVCETWYAHDPSFANAQDDVVFSKFKMANTIAWNFSFYAAPWLGINIRPYYQQPWGKVNVEGMANYLQGVDGDVEREKTTNFGISGTLVLAFRRGKLF